MNLAELLKDSAYKLTQFKPAQIAAFEAGITQKDTQVRQSLVAKQRATQLLEAAKRAVEIAIEQDEAAGMAYLARENSTE